MAVGVLQRRPVPGPTFGTQPGALVAHLRAVVMAQQSAGERCHAMFVDARHGVLGEASIGMGNRSTLSLRMRDVFGTALRLDAAGVILAHNHPSGKCRPSAHDITATRRLAEVARALDIALIDHLIFTQEAVYSMRAGGLL